MEVSNPIVDWLKMYREFSGKYLDVKWSPIGAEYYGYVSKLFYLFK